MRHDCRQVKDDNANKFINILSGMETAACDVYIVFKTSASITMKYSRNNKLIVYNFLKIDLDKIQKFKNPTLDINKNKLNKNSKYKIFLNKTQFNNLLDQGFIKYKLTDSKKRKHMQKGDGIGSLLSMAFYMIKPALPKIIATVGLSGLSTGVSYGLNKVLNKKKKILEIDEKQ